MYLRGKAQLDVRRRIVRQMIPSVSGLSLLDIGCGDGSVSVQYVAEARHLVLVDLSEGMLERAKSMIQPDDMSKVEFVQGSLEDFKSEPADVVLLIGVLAYVPDVGDALRRVSELTRPDGRVVVQFTDSATWSAAVLRNYSRLRSRGKIYTLNVTSYERVSALAEAAGLQRVGRARHWPLGPGMGRLPDNVQHRYLTTTLGSGEQRARGSENYLVFRKR